MEKPKIIAVDQVANAAWCAATANAGFLLAGAGAFFGSTFLAIACNLPAFAAGKGGTAAL